jgi:hypothetical protein
MDSEHTRRRFEKRRQATPKSLLSALKPLNNAQFVVPTTTAYTGDVMKAFCKRLAGRVVIIGATPFKFGPDGVCELVPRGRASEITDFLTLLKMNGVEEVSSVKPWEMISPPPAPVLPTKEEEVPKSEEPTNPGKRVPILPPTEEIPPADLPDWIKEAEENGIPEDSTDSNSSPVNEMLVKPNKRRRSSAHKLEE